ncbi:hypothetical protein D3C76_1073030 [compost metagenome]
MFGGAAVLAQITVLAVTNNRMTQMGEMAAQLVLATGFRFQFYQSVARGREFTGGNGHFDRRQTAIIGHRRLRIFVFTGKFIGDFIQLFDQRIIERRVVHQPAAHNSVIAFLNLMLFELLR